MIECEVHENSIFVFQSQKIGNIARLVRSADYLLAAFVIGGASFPLYAVTIFGSAYIMTLNVELCVF